MRRVIERERRLYTAFGRLLACDLPLSAELAVPRMARERSVDLAVEAATAPPEAWNCDAGADVAVTELVWTSPEEDRSGEALTRLQRRGESWRLSFVGIGDFYVGHQRIVVVPDSSPDDPLRGIFPSDRAALVELRLLGPVMAFWLELQGVLTLHASAVVLDGVGVAFLASHGSGKSSLAAALLTASRSGRASPRQATLLSDDLLAVEVDPGPTHPESVDDPPGVGPIALPSYPFVRFWPAEAQRFTGSAEAWPRVLASVDKRRVATGGAPPAGFPGVGAFSRFHGRPVPLAALLLPSRGGHDAEGGVGAGRVGEVHFDPLSPAEALLQLIDTSYLPRLPVGAGLQPGRMERLAALVEAVPVRRLRYPDGYDRLPEVAVAVGDWCRRLSREPS